MTDAIEAFTDHVLGTSYDDLPVDAVLATIVYSFDPSRTIAGAVTSVPSITAKPALDW